MCKLTAESINLLIEDIIFAVEHSNDYDEQFEAVRTELEAHGIIEEIEE